MNSSQAGQHNDEHPTPETAQCAHHSAAHATLEKLHKGVDFLYGILIAMSLEKVIEGVMHASSSTWFVDPTHPHTEEAAVVLHAPAALMYWRTLIFLIMVARFYLGSIRYFDKTYKSHALDLKGFQPRFFADFLIGLIHFLLFFPLSLAVTVPPGRISFFSCFKFSSFAIMLMVILMYDTFWLAARWMITRQRSEEWKVLDEDAFEQIQRWSLRNFVTTLWIVGLLVLAGVIWPVCPGWAESIALIPLFIASLQDFSEVIGVRRFFAP
jgi:hypothetical protein